MTTAAAVPRRVAVELLSTRQELVHIVRVAVAIVLGVWLYLASALGDARTTRSNLLPYQAVIQNRPEADQRMFRELQEALLEAERLRSTDGAWPDVAALANQGIPPFTSASRTGPASPPGCSSPRNRSPAHRQIRHSRTRNTTGCSTARCSMCRRGVTLTASTRPENSFGCRRSRVGYSFTRSVPVASASHDANPSNPCLVRPCRNGLPPRSRRHAVATAS
jgi:hypothetical protein